VGHLTGSPRGIAGLRIAHLIECDGPGGAERVIADLAAHLQASGAYNVVLVPADGEGWLTEQLSGSGVAIQSFHLNAPVSPACARSLAALLRRHQIDVAHSHEFSMAVYGSWASWLAGVRHVITMHGSRYYAHRLRRRLALRAAIALSGRTVAVSTSLADRLRRDLGVAGITTVPNGVRHAAADRATVRKELQLRPRDRLLVAVGNLYAVKGHRHLLDAVALLGDRHPAVHVAICGRGDLAEALRSQARARGIAHRLHLLGLRSDVAAVLAAADVFVHPSESEALPLAVLEAMFAARPIVATDVGEVGVALAYGDAGLLVEPANPRALASALDRLLLDADLAQSLAERAYRRAVDEYDVSHMVQRYADIYVELSRNHHSRSGAQQSFTGEQRDTSVVV
jgi:glycosyltransferase involved in cell wall biosynthesis